MSRLRRERRVTRATSARATLIDDRGLSARVGADHLGHSKVSMTQDVYMACGKTHTQVADLLDDAINGA
jgi:integrase